MLKTIGKENETLAIKNANPSKSLQKINANVPLLKKKKKKRVRKDKK